MLLPVIYTLYVYDSMGAVPDKGIVSSSMMFFPGILLRYFLNDFETVSVDPVSTGIICAVAFLTLCIPIERYLHFRVFSVSFLITYQLLLLLVIIFMQGIYTYIPETSHVPRACSVAAILWLQFMVQVIYFPC